MNPVVAKFGSSPQETDAQVSGRLTPSASEGRAFLAGVQPATFDSLPRMLKPKKKPPRGGFWDRADSWSEADTAQRCALILLCDAVPVGPRQHLFGQLPVIAHHQS